MLISHFSLISTVTAPSEEEAIVAQLPNRAQLFERRLALTQG